MPSLLEIQRGFRGAALDGDSAALSAWIADDGVRVSDRIEIHRNNILSSITLALADAFPVVCRLVDARFFAFAAHEFICELPPGTPCIADYGDRFAEFLADFSPCRDLVYLADVARLEWCLHRAARAGDMAPLDPAALGGLASEDAERLILRLQPSFGYLRSPWPVAEIWRANQAGSTRETPVNLDAGGVLLEIRRRNGVVEFREIAPAIFAFRTALMEGTPLGDAIGAVTGSATDFDINAEFAALFIEDAVASVNLVGSA